MQLLALNPDFRFTNRVAPETRPEPEERTSQLDTLRAALRRTRTASAILADMQLVSNLQGMSALDALCIRLAMLLGRPLRSYAPGTAQTHFDEAWLLGIFNAVARDDTDSYAFLLRTRLSRAEASEIHFLVCRAQSAFKG